MKFKKIHLCILSSLFIISCAEIKLLQSSNNINANLVSGEKALKNAGTFIQASLGKSKALMKLQAELPGKVMVWQGLDGVVLVTRYGRLISVNGLPVSLRQIRAESIDPLESGDYKKTYSANYDYMPKYAYNIQVKSYFVKQHSQYLKVLGVNKKLLKITEFITFNQFKQTKTNVYWVDEANNNVWKSIQYYSANAQPITIEQVFKADFLIDAKPTMPDL